MCSITLWPILHQLKPQFVSNIKFFCVFSKNRNNVIIVTKNDKVFREVVHMTHMLLVSGSIPLFLKHFCFNSKLE